MAPECGAPTGSNPNIDVDSDDALLELLTSQDNFSKMEDFGIEVSEAEEETDRDDNIEDENTEIEEEVEEIIGCTNPIATNYNPDATKNDPSLCKFPPPPIDNTIINGCTDSTATNYNPNATQDDGSCTYPPTPILGCMDPTATNHDPLATEDDGSCQFAAPPVNTTPTTGTAVHVGTAVSDRNPTGGYRTIIRNNTERKAFDRILLDNPDFTPLTTVVILITDQVKQKIFYRLICGLVN